MNYKSGPIPVKPYVRTYLINKYPSSTDGLIHIPSKDSVMILLKQLLSKQIYRREKEITLSLYTEQVNISLLEDIFNRNGFSLSKSNTVVFNHYLEERIKLRLLDWYTAANLNNPNIELKVVINQFKQTFGFDEENFPYETMKKALYRERLHQTPQLSRIENLGAKCPTSLRHRI